MRRPMFLALAASAGLLCVGAAQAGGYWAVNINTPEVGAVISNRGIAAQIGVPYGVVGVSSYAPDGGYSNYPSYGTGYRAYTSYGDDRCAPLYETAPRVVYVPQDRGWHGDRGRYEGYGHRSRDDRDDRWDQGGRRDYDGIRDHRWHRN